MFAKRIEVTKTDRGIELKPSDIQADRNVSGRRFGVAEERIASMVESMKTEGQKQPIIVYKRQHDGLPACKAGYTRLEAAQRIEREDPKFRVWVHFEAGDGGWECFKTTVTENLERNEVGDMDHAFNQETMRRRYGKTDAEIAAFYRMHPSKVCKLKHLLLLPETLQRAVHSGELSTAAAIAYSEIPGDEQREMWEEKVVKVADIQERIRRKQAVMTPAAATTPATKPVEQARPAGPVEMMGPSTLDFTRLNSQSDKPSVRTRQRTIGQTKDLLDKFTGASIPEAVRTFAAALVEYMAGAISAEEVASRAGVPLAE